MRVALLTIGSRGDVQPFVVLGRALRARGHDVVLATCGEFKAMALGAGLEFRPLVTFRDGFARTVLTDPRVRAALRRGPSIYRMARAAPRPGAAERQALTEAMVAAADGADVIVNTSLTRIGALARPGVPWCSVASWPVTATAAWPALGAPALPLGRRYNRLTHRTAGAVEWLAYRSSVNRTRVCSGLPKAGLRSPFADDGRSRPILYQFSPRVFAPPPDWPPHCHVTGYWSDGNSWNQRPELTDFVERGAAPLVAAFGSAWLACGPELLAATVAAARTTGHRLVLVGGPEGETPADGLDLVRCETANFAWLLPRCAAVLHHGGQGTTAAAVSAGAPQVVVPCYADQPLWARRMRALGVSAPEVPFATLTVERLADAIRTATRHPGIAASAAALAEAVRGERGVEKAADVIEDYAGAVCRP